MKRLAMVLAFLIMFCQGSTLLAAQTTTKTTKTTVVQEETLQKNASKKLLTNGMSQTVHTGIDTSPSHMNPGTEMSLNLPIVFIWPAGGEDVTPVAYYTVKWKYPTSIPDKSLWVINLVKEDGTFVREISRGRTGASGQAETKVWFFPEWLNDDDPVVEDYVIKHRLELQAPEYNANFTSLSRPFTFRKKAEGVQITEMSGSEIWHVGETHTIKWRTTPSDMAGSADITIRHLIQTAQHYHFLGNVDLAEKKFSFKIPAIVVPGDYRVKIHRGQVEDYSDLKISILGGCPLEFILPTEGAVIDAGSTMKLTWKDYRLSSGPISLKIYRNGLLKQSIKAQSPGINVTAGTYGEGFYYMAIPAITGADEQWQVAIATLENPENKITCNFTVHKSDR